MKAHDFLKGSLEPLEAVNNAEERWRSLSEYNKVFTLSWEWIENWLCLIKGECQIYLFSCKKEDTLCGLGFVALTKAKRLKKLVAVNRICLNEYPVAGFNMVISYNGLLCMDSMKAVVWRCFIDTITHADFSWDEIYLSSLSKEDADVILSYQKRDVSLEVDKTFYQWKISHLDEVSVDNVLSLFKRKSRQQLNQSLREVGGENALTLTRAESVSQAMTYFEEMEELHTELWKRRGKQGSFHNFKWTNFHRRLIENLPNDTLFMAKIETSDSVLGYLYGHIYHNTMFMHQSAFSVSEDNRIRPGYLSHFAAIKYAVSKRLSEYDFLPDEEGSYKKFFCAQGEEVFWICIKKKRLRYAVEETCRKVLKR